MNTYWKAIGIGALAVGILYYPSLRLYKYLVSRRAKAAEGELKLKPIVPAFRGKNKAHNRSLHNGHGHHDKGEA